MSHLIARILLAILMWPLAAMVYLIAFVVLAGMFRWGRPYEFWGAGALAWGFVGGYWLLLWYRSVRWDGGRVGLTLASTVAALVISVLAAPALNAVERGFGHFAGSALFPLLWVVGTIFVWRESAAERRARLGSHDALVCPQCGYNLTGLSEARCPECGTRYTLSDLYARQPSREATEIET